MFLHSIYCLLIYSIFYLFLFIVCLLWVECSNLKVGVCVSCPGCDLRASSWHKVRIWYILAEWMKLSAFAKLYHWPGAYEVYQDDRSYLYPSFSQAIRLSHIPDSLNVLGFAVICSNAMELLPWISEISSTNRRSLQHPDLLFLDLCPGSSLTQLGNHGQSLQSFPCTQPQISLFCSWNSLD